MKHFCIGLVLSLASLVAASESSVIAFRAQKSIDAGKFAKGYSQLERALLASRKESDLNSEGRILISMAQIRIMSLDLDLADSLLSIVREDVLNPNSKLSFVTTKISLANARNDYKAATKICREISEDSIKKVDKPLKAALYSECAVAYSATKDEDAAENALKLVGKNGNKKGGFYAYTMAKMAMLKGDSEADSLYKIAGEKAVQSNRIYTSASILWERSQVKGIKPEEAEDLKLRCKNAFELMGLPKNAKRCEE